LSGPFARGFFTAPGKAGRAKGRVNKFLEGTLRVVGKLFIPDRARLKSAQEMKKSAKGMTGNPFTRWPAE